MHCKTDEFRALGKITILLLSLASLLSIPKRDSVCPLTEDFRETYSNYTEMSVLVIIAQQYLIIYKDFISFFPSFGHDLLVYYSRFMPM